MIDATLPILTDLVHDAASPLVGASADYDRLLEFIGDAQFVLLGEASHGTHEFYRHRAQITKRLIQEKRLYCGRGGGGLAGCLSRESICSRYK
jgi:erythromycin esterase-like protein